MEEAINHSSSRVIRTPIRVEETAITLKRQFVILYALMMHDIKSRFFGNGLGYAVMMAWPLIHVIAIISIFAFSGRLVPYGSSIVLFAATGVMPFVYVTYISRFMLLGVMTNRSFLQYPIIKVLDIMTARAVLELINMAVITFVIFMFMFLWGIECAPIAYNQACEAMLASMLFGLGLGYLNGVITMIIPLWNIVHVILTIIAYAISGILLLPTGFPGWVQYYLSFNPVMQAVIWMRSAFYLDFDAQFLDRTYLLAWGFGTLAFGVILERLLRSVVLQSR